MNIAAHIVVRDAAEAAGWYANAFGAQKVSRIPLPGDKVMSVELAFGDSAVHVGSEFPDMGIVSPLTIGGTATVLPDQHRRRGRPLDPRCSTPERRHATNSPTRSGASASASSATRSVTAGTSLNGSTTYPTKRSSPQPPKPSAAANYARSGT